MQVKTVRSHFPPYLIDRNRCGEMLAGNAGRIPGCYHLFKAYIAVLWPSHLTSRNLSWRNKQTNGKRFSYKTCWELLIKLKVWAYPSITTRWLNSSASIQYSTVRLRKRMVFTIMVNNWILFMFYYAKGAWYIITSSVWSHFCKTIYTCVLCVCK